MGKNRQKIIEELQRELRQTRARLSQTQLALRRERHAHIETLRKANAFLHETDRTMARLRESVERTHETAGDAVVEAKSRLRDLFRRTGIAFSKSGSES